MIKRIELVNFMSHSNTVIEPADGLTVLVGPNNCGKSTVMTALQILCHNETSTYVTRHGEKECSITVETTAGDIVQWVRNRNTSKYIINGETFDRLRGKVPPVLHQVLRLPKVYLEQSQDEFDIHFGSQKDPVFLINDSGRAAAGFFAASSDASRFIEMQKLHGQKVKEANRDLKRLDAEAEVLKDEIELLEPIPNLRESFDECSQLMKTIEIHDAAAANLKVKIEKLNRLQFQMQQYRDRAQAFKDLAQPPELAETTQLSSCIEKVAGTADRIKVLRNANKCFKKMAPPPSINQVGPIQELVSRIKAKTRGVANAKLKEDALISLDAPPETAEIQPLVGLVGNASRVNKQIERLESQLDEFMRQSKDVEQELSQFATANPTCPACEQPLTKEHLLKKVIGSRRGE